jgi:hypothetical protein
MIVILMLIFTVSFIAAACKGNEPDASRPTSAPADNTAETQTADNTAEAQIPENTSEAQDDDNDEGGDFDNAFRNLDSISIMETDEVYYYHSNDSWFLYYTGKEALDSGVLCGRPECLHDDTFPNAECDGFVYTALMGLSLYDDGIWYVGYGNESQTVLYRMDLDGTNRKAVRDVAEFGTGYAYQKAFIHRGKVILTAYHSSVENAVPYEEVSLWYCGVKSGELKKAVAVKDSDRGHVIKVCFRNESVYVLITSTDYDNYDSNVDIFRINLDTDETETLYHGESFDMGMGDIWVSEDGTVYTTTMADERYKPLGLYRLEGGELKLVYDFSEDNLGYTYQALIFDKYVLTLYAEKTPEGYEAGFLLIKDFEGNTVFNGKLPMESLNSLGIEYDWYAFPGIACRGDAIIASISLGKDEGRGSAAVVRYEITPDGLEETLIGVMKWG